MTGFTKRTARKILRDRLQRFFLSIKDEELRKLVERDTLVTGGAITSLMMGEKINDYDIYFKTFDTTKAVAEYYVNEFNEKFHAGDDVKYKPAVHLTDVPNLHGDVEKRILIYMKSAGVAGEGQDDYRYFETLPEEATDDFMSSLKDAEDFYAVASDQVEIIPIVEDIIEQTKKAEHKYRPLFLTDNAISLSDKVQIIIRFYGTPEEIHKNFDFIHCTGIYDYASDKLTVTEEAMESMRTKRLVYSGSLYPIASVMRIRKFLKRGWKISAGQILKILAQVSKVNFEDPVMLREQIMGVDVAYMRQLINELKNREAGTRIDTTYLAALIDRIFDEA